MRESQWMQGVAIVVALLTAGIASAQPANDSCANATVIASLPLTEMVDVSTATNDNDTSPGSSRCASFANSIWYEYTAGASDVIVVVDTYEGSTFPFTTIDAYTGSCGGLTSVTGGAFSNVLANRGVNLAQRVPAGTSVRLCVSNQGVTPGGGPIRVHVFEAPDFEIDVQGYRAEFDVRALAGGATGDFFVTWTGYDGGYEQRGRLFGADGTPAGAQLVLDTVQSYYMGVAGRASDGFIVAWQDYPDVRAQRIDAAGAALGSTFIVNQTTAYYGASVDSDANGDFVVAWSGRSPDVRFRLFDSAGTAQGAEQYVVGASSRYAPDVARDDAGNFVIVWESGDDVQGQRFDSTGAALGTIFTVSSGDSYEPSVAAAPSGEFFVVWDGVGRSIFGQAFDATGAPDGSPVELSNRDDEVTNHRPRVDGDASGNFVVVREDDGGRADFSRNIDVTGRRVGPGGAILGPDFLVNTVNGSDQYWPVVGVAPDGAFMVAWGDNAGYQPWSAPKPEAVIGRIIDADAFISMECPSIAAATCKAAIFPGKAKLLVRNDGVDPEDLVINWKLVKGDATTAADFGDPTATDDIFLCLYDDGGALVTQAALPAAGLCAGKPCWKGLGNPAGSKGFKYKDGERTPNGVLKAVLKPGDAGKTKVVLKAGRRNLATGPAGGPPPIPITGSLTAQLHVPATGECWSTTFEATTAKRNSAGIFQASGD